MTARARHRFARGGRRLAVVGAAAALTAALAQTTTTAAFTAQTGDGTNKASTAASFCTSPASQTVVADADSSVYQQNTTTNYGTVASVGIYSGDGQNARIVLHFPRASVPSGCSVTGATLKLQATTVTGSRSLDVYRIDPSATWTETGVTWTTRPAVTGAAASGGSLTATGPQQWDVTAIVTAMYSSPTDTGMLVRDRTEGSATYSSTTPVYKQVYDSREGTTPPKLVVTWG